MIVVKIMGGLGNQLFQYALGRHLAIKNNTELKLDISFYEKNKSREFKLCYLNTKYSLANTSEIPVLKRNRKLNKIQKTYYSLIDKKLKICNEVNFSFDKKLLELTDNYYLFGYWQSEKYFKEISSHLVKELSLKNPLTIDSNLFFDDINNANSVAVHVRRCDYKNHERLSLLNKDYYQKAFSLILEKVEQPKFFIFSDDIAWCKENFKFEFPLHYVDTSNDLIDFELMKICKHHIIANSTYSWWATYLSKSKNSITIAPLNWFKPNTSFVSKDLYMSYWHII